LRHVLKGQLETLLHDEYQTTWEAKKGSVSADRESIEAGEKFPGQFKVSVSSKDRDPFLIFPLRD
jgi:hypothetical protein